MATRSRIAIELPDGSVESIYCHWDGYPEGNGRTLLDHYTLPEKVQDLINLGSISSLAPTLEPEGKHSFDRRLFFKVSYVITVFISWFRCRHQ